MSTAWLELLCLCKSGLAKYLELTGRSSAVAELQKSGSALCHTVRFKRNASVLSVIRWCCRLSLQSQISSIPEIPIALSGPGLAQEFCTNSSFKLPVLCSLRTLRK